MYTNCVQIYYVIRHDDLYLGISRRFKLRGAFMTQDSNNNSSIKKLELAHNIREFHHKSLWEEEKHFTWWISIVLSLQILLYTTGHICNQNKFIFIVIASFIGIFICFTAFRIVRLESEYFHTALSRFVTEYNEIYPTSQLPSVHKEANKGITDLIISVFKLEIGVRDSFQFLFLFFIFIFVLILICSCLTLIY